MDNSFAKKLLIELEIAKEKLREAEKTAKMKNTTVVQVLIQMGVVDPKRILQLFTSHYGVQVVNLDSKDIPPNIINLIPKELARKFKVIPIDRIGQHIIVAMKNPHDLKICDLIRFKTGFIPKPVIAIEASINSAINKYYESMDIDLSNLRDKSTPIGKRKDDRAIIDKESDPDQKADSVVKLVDQILVQCSVRGSSDIHIEPYETYFRVRLRTDGVLQEIARPPIALKNPLISRIKIMSRLDIAEKRLPQDGGIRVTIRGKPIDFRVNTCPTLYGEKVVLRLLDKSNLQVDLTGLGFERDDFARFSEAIHRPFGMVLVTGPTGSGKTTTLYSALSELNKTTENIMTAEDPVEFNLDGINQVQINPSIDFEFSTALRSFLRQDPDIIMVGEIRDQETGEIAIKAALTGHLVLSTLHTNSAADTIIRLQNLGLESFNLISSLNAIVAQRLVRRICEKCKEGDETITPDTLIELGLAPQLAKKTQALKGRGCSACLNTGYKGRIAIFEVMAITDPIKEAIMEGKSALELKRIGIQRGMRTLRQNALMKVVFGQIDVKEVIKSTASDERDDSEVPAA